MQYLGALSLLGRIADRAPLNEDDKSSLDRCFEDANSALNYHDSDYVFKKTMNGSYSLFDK